MNATTKHAQSKPRLNFCIRCGEQYWAVEERCPHCGARPNPFYDRLGITRALMEDEYRIEY
jgi:hypothetical protein